MAKEPDLKSGEAERCLGSSPSPSAITYQGQEPFFAKGSFLGFQWFVAILSPFTFFRALEMLSAASFFILKG